jgi:hypothetical protein
VGRRAKAMPAKKTWQVLLVVSWNVVLASSCVYLLASPPAEAGQSEASFHRVLQLVLVIMGNLSWCILFASIPKRQIFFIALLAPLAQIVMACDTVWKCGAILFVWKLLGAAALLILTAIMRKLSSRLVTQTAVQVPTTQKALVCAFFAAATLSFAFPNAIAFSVLEFAMLFAFCVFSPWMYFLTFIFTSKEAFRDVEVFSGFQEAGVPGTEQGAAGVRAGTMQNIKRVQQTQKHLGRNMWLCHVFVHFLFVVGVLLIPKMPSNIDPGGCHERSRGDVIAVVESVRFCVVDTFDAIILVGIWHTIVIFTAKRRRNHRKKQRKLAVPPKASKEDSYSNVSHSKSGEAAKEGSYDNNSKSNQTNPTSGRLHSSTGFQNLSTSSVGSEMEGTATIMPLSYTAESYDIDV